MSTSPAARVASSVPITPMIVVNMNRSAPSSVFSATLPVNPSVTTTSTGEPERSRPSTLP